MARYLIATDMETSRVISIVAFFAFMPSIIAYGRILGSSWAPLRASSGMLGRGEPSPFHPEKPTAREQVVNVGIYQHGCNAVCCHKHSSITHFTCYKSGHVHPFRSS